MIPIYNNKSIKFLYSPKSIELGAKNSKARRLERNKGLEAVQSIQLRCEPGSPLLPGLSNRRRQRRWRRWVPHLFLALLRLHLVFRQERGLHLLAQEFKANSIERTEDGIHGWVGSKRRLTELLFELMMRRKGVEEGFI